MNLASGKMHFRLYSDRQARCNQLPYDRRCQKRGFLDKGETYRAIQKDGLNFVSLYIKNRTSDNYDVKYI
jgi:hypothetical protein